MININKQKLLKRVLSAIFAVSVSMSSVAFDSTNDILMEVSANSTVDFTLDYTKTVSSDYPQITNGVLKLEDFVFSTTADTAINVPRGTTIEFSGTNSINASKGVGIKAEYDSYSGTDYDLTIEGNSNSTLSINASSAGIYVKELDLIIDNADLTISAGTGIYMVNNSNTDYSFNMEDSSVKITSTSGCGVQLERILGTSTWSYSDVTINAKTIGISVNGNGGDGFVDCFTIKNSDVNVKASGNSSVYLEDVNNFEVVNCDSFNLSGANNGIQAVGAKLYFKKSEGGINGSVNGIFSIENPNDLRADKGLRFIEFDGGDLILSGGTSAFKTDLSYDTDADEIVFSDDIYPYAGSSYTDKVAFNKLGSYTQMYNSDVLVASARIFDGATSNSPSTDTEGDLYFNITLNYNYGDSPSDVQPSNSIVTTNGNGYLDSSLLPPATRNGYTFKGWYLGSDGSGSNVTDGYTFASDQTIYAVWDAVVPAAGAQIHYNANGGTISTSSSNVSTTTLTTNDDGKITLLPLATRDGYTFVGWYDGDNIVSTSYIYSKDTYLVAKWEETSYITFHYAYDDQDDVTRAVGSDGTVIGGFPTVNNRPGIVFLGWFTSDGKQVEDGATFSSTQTLTAQWMDSYTVNFDPVLNLFEPPAQTTNSEGTLDSLPKMICPGYGLVGWYTQPDEFGELVTTDTIFTSDTTIYAKWVADEFTITFKPDYSGSIEFTMATSDYMLTSLPAAPSRPGYAFEGWYTKQNGLGDKLYGGYEFDEDTIVYALWSDSDDIYNDNYSGSSFESETGVVTISLDPQHDSYTAFDDIQTNVYGRLTSYPGILVANGLAFDGWYTGRDGTGEKVYEDTKFLNNTTIYANWVQGEVTVTINQDYSGAFEIPFATTNNRLETLPNPKVRPGYQFEGWYWVSNSTSSSDDATIRDMSINLSDMIISNSVTSLDAAVTTSTTFTTDSTIYASWSVVDGGTIIVSFDSNGGVPGYYIDQTGVDGRLASLPTPTRDGYIFLGWFDGNLEISTSYIFRFDSEVYAKWQLESDYQDDVNHSTGGNVMYTRDIPTLERLYIDKFQNLMVGDYITGLGTVSPNRPDLGTFVGWYHGASLSRALDYFELQSILVTEELFATGIYPKFEKNIVSTGGSSSSGSGTSTQVPVTSTNISLVQLF